MKSFFCQAVDTNVSCNHNYVTRNGIQLDFIEDHDNNFFSGSSVSTVDNGNDDDDISDHETDDEMTSSDDEEGNENDDGGRHGRPRNNENNNGITNGNQMGNRAVSEVPNRNNGNNNDNNDNDDGTNSNHDEDRNQGHIMRHEEQHDLRREQEQEEEQEQEQEELEPLRLPQHPNCPQLDRPMILNKLRMMASQTPPSSSCGTNCTETNNKIPRLLLDIARSEEIPLIPSDIDWFLLTSQLQSYPASTIGDVHGAHLLQSILRMGPPLFAVEEAIRLFPKSCINMDSFYAACQYTSSPSSSSQTETTSSVNPIIELLIQKTMKARQAEGIGWGMLAFLGDARIRTIHAQYLLSSIPEAVVDEGHGVFGVSPLDRMLSGAFIHGDNGEWVEKVKLALLTAAKGKLAERTFGAGTWLRAEAEQGDANVSEDSAVKHDRDGRLGFYPYHLLVKRLIHEDFKGTHFGVHSFLRTLMACSRAHFLHSEVSKPPFHQLDGDGNLPIHIALGSTCDTNLGTEGERKLITYLLRKNLESACIPNGDGKLPLRLSIENGWPCYDIIIGAFLQYNNNNPPPLSSSPVDELRPYSDSRTIEPSHSKHSEIKKDHPAKGRHYQLFGSILHTILSGPYCESFQMSGARAIVRYILKKYPHAAKAPNPDGRLALHVGIENGWPCHDILMNAAPLALQTRDAKTRFYPFQIAALSRLQLCMYEESENNERKENDGDLLQLNVLYELIREAPNLLSHPAMIYPDIDDKDSTAKNEQVSSKLLLTDNDFTVRKLESSSETCLMKSESSHPSKKRKKCG